MRDLFDRKAKNSLYQRLFHIERLPTLATKSCFAIIVYLRLRYLIFPFALSSLRGIYIELEFLWIQKEKKLIHWWGIQTFSYILIFSRNFHSLNIKLKKQFSRMLWNTVDDKILSSNSKKRYQIDYNRIIYLKLKIPIVFKYQMC